MNAATSGSDATFGAELVELPFDLHRHHVVAGGLEAAVVRMLSNEACRSAPSYRLKPRALAPVVSMGA